MGQSLRVVGRLLQQMHAQKRWLLLAVGLGVLTIGSGIGLLGLSAYLISAAALHPPLDALALAIVGVRLFGIVRGIFRYIERLITHTVIFRQLAQLRVWVYQALEPLVPARLHALGVKGTSTPTSGDLLNRLVADIDILQEFYVRIISPPIVALLIGLAMWFVLGAYSPIFALTLLSFYLLAGIGVPVLTHVLSRKVGQHLIATRAALRTGLIDSIQGMPDLLAFGREDQQLDEVKRLNQRLVSLQTGMAYIDGMRNALDIVLTNGCVWIMLLVAIPLVHSGQLNGVYLALLALAALASFEAVAPLSAATQQLGGSVAAARRLFEIVDAQPAISEPALPTPVPMHYNLDTRHLTFSYTDEAPPVLHDLSFTLPQGRCLAIVGPSGAGKSTIARLLLRFWEYEQGVILLDGRELRSYRQADIHRFTSVVEQHTHLFNETIRENLLLAKPDASEQELTLAAQQAHIHEFIQALPQGYDTRIGEQGLKLSGGERQRLALARAFLKDAPILLFDEATAHLDAITEQEVLATMRTLIQGRTTILITHRLSGLEMADEILVMQAGRVQERGTHDELVQAKGLYWRLWQLQHQVIAPVI